MDEREEIDRIKRGMAADLERLMTTVAAIQGRLSDAEDRLVALGRGLERRRMLEALRGGTDESEAPASDGARASTEAAVASASDAGRRDSSRILILAALRDAGGTLPKTAVRDLVLAAGWVPETYKRMRGRLKANHQIIDADDGRSWAITDEGLSQLGGKGRETANPSEEGDR